MIDFLDSFIESQSYLKMLASVRPFVKSNQKNEALFLKFSNKHFI